MRGPVERAEKGARGDGGVGGAQLAAADAGGHERADAAFVAIALGHDLFAQGRRQGIDFEVRSGALEVVDEAAHVRHGQRAQARHERAGRVACVRQRGRETFERAILAEVEQLVLAAEVVIQVAGGQVRGDRDVAHARGGVAAGTEDAAGRAENLHPSGVGALQTPVRKSNHRSILACPDAAV